MPLSRCCFAYFSYSGRSSLSLCFLLNSCSKAIRSRRVCSILVLIRLCSYPSQNFFAPLLTLLQPTVEGHHFLQRNTCSNLAIGELQIQFLLGSQRGILRGLLRSAFA